MYCRSFCKNNLSTLFLFFVSLTFSLNVFAQNNFQPGSVTKSNNAVLEGYIDYREWDQNPRSIRFKKDKNAAIEIFSVADLSEFSMATGEKYIKAIVKKDMRPVDLETLKAEQSNKDTVVVDTVFLRQIRNCEYFTLYLLNETKVHFYIKEPSGQFEELGYKVYYRSSTTADLIVPSNLYRNQLEQYIFGRPDYEKLRRRLERIRYTEKDLGDFVLELATKKNEVDKKTTASEKKTTVFISIGGAFSKLNISGNTLLRDHRISNSYSPVISVGVNLFSKRDLGVLIIRPELSYSYLKYSGKYERGNTINSSTISETYDLKIGNLTPSVSILYSFVRNQKCRVFAGGQLGYTFSSYPQNSFTKENEVGGGNTTYNNYLDYKKSWANVSVKAGAMFRQRYEVNGTALVAGSFSNFSNINIRPSVYAIQFAYHF